MVSGSPSLTVPLTQSTAKVLRFRCLFTHDLRRKAKRWQDGFVRYHTFNKRVMVFDDQGNFVGDLHWRQEETIQDGDELELDKGVLIQVGESVEKTETDLSPLFERRKASQTSPSQPSQSQTRNFPTRSSQPSSQPSRSLNDLLGIRRTPIERFRSPHEQRPTPRPVEIPEESRPAKRQRTVPSQPAQRPPVIDLSEPSSVRAPTAKEPTTKPTSRPERAQPPHPPPVAPNRPTPTPPITQPRTRKVPEEPSPASIRPTPAQPVTVRPRRNPPPAPARPTPTPTTSHVTRSEQTQTSENARPSTHSSFYSDSTAATPRNTLQLSREKPRKKLMYRALLPGQANASETRPSEQREPQSGGTKTRGSGSGLH